MNDETRVELRKCRLFSSLTNQEFDNLSRIVSTKKISGGETIFSEGDVADKLYILGSGSVELIKYSSTGRELVIRAVSAGEAFAEAAVFLATEYPATALARENSLLFFIKRGDFLSFIKDRPEVSLKLMGFLSSLLVKLNKLVQGVFAGTVKSRLASYFLARAKSEGKEFALGFQKAKLATMVGTIPETLSRNLKKFSADGVICIKGSKIVILDEGKLEELAQFEN